MAKKTQQDKEKEYLEKVADETEKFFQSEVSELHKRCGGK